MLTFLNWKYALWPWPSVKVTVRILQKRHHISSVISVKFQRLRSDRYWDLLVIMFVDQVTLWPWPSVKVTIWIDGKRQGSGSNHFPKFQRSLSDSLGRSGVNTFEPQTHRQTDTHTHRQTHIQTGARSCSSVRIPFYGMGLKKTIVWFELRWRQFRVGKKKSCACETLYHFKKQFGHCFFSEEGGNVTDGVTSHM